jgi:hypothetical protein
MKLVNDKQDNRNRVPSVRTTTILSTVSVQTNENTPAPQGNEDNVHIDWHKEGRLHGCANN